MNTSKWEVVWFPKTPAYDAKGTIIPARQEPAGENIFELGLVFITRLLAFVLSLAMLGLFWIFVIQFIKFAWYL